MLPERYKPLLEAIRQNCRISDSRFWGTFSTCGLLLRLRELYRFEHGMPLGSQPGTAEVAEWIGRLEGQWESLEAAEFGELEYQGRRFGHFDAAGLNALLLPEGMVYAAGIGMYGKPVFVLAAIEAQMAIEGINVLIAGREFVRDLSTHPAMSQSLDTGPVIIGRLDMTTALLHGKYDEVRHAPDKKGLLRDAFDAYGIAGDPPLVDFERIARVELDAYLRHEVGEVMESRRLGDGWQRMQGAIADMPRASAIARGIKDSLSDTCEAGMLGYIIKTQNAGALCLMLHFLSGMRHALYAPLRAAYPSFRESRDWGLIEEARAAIHTEASILAMRCLEAYCREPGSMESAIEALPPCRR